MEEHHITVQRTARYHTLGDADRAREVWIVLHGYGHLARYFLRKFEGLEEGRFFVAPEGLSRFYLDDGHTRVGASWMTREDREHEITDQIGYLDLLISGLRGSVPPDTPLGVVGFSQGVATACRYAVLGSTPVPRLILWGGTMPPDISAAALGARLSTCDIAIVYGEKDTLVTAAAGAPGEARLREAGVPFSVHRHDAGHDLDTILLGRLLKA